MRIAVCYDNGNVFQHFGHTEYFKIYDVAEGEIIKTAVINTTGNGHCALADFLKTGSIDTLICGGIGGGAKNALAGAGIELFAGVTGSADTAVQDFLVNRLNYDSEYECTEHGEHHGGDCRDHSCDHAH